MPYDGWQRAFGTALDLEGRQLLVSTRAPGDPYASFSPANFLYDLQGSRFVVSAALAGGPAVSVHLAGERALVDAHRIRYGTTPTVFDLP